MFEQNVRSCADRIISIYQPHLRPIVRGKAKAKVEFGAKIGASIVNGYTYVDHLSWDTEDKKRAVGERNEIEATFDTSKRVYRANDIRAKLDKTADTWIGACFFAKNAMKFLRGLLCLIIEKLGLMALKIKIIKTFDDLVGVWATL